MMWPMGWVVEYYRYKARESEDFDTEDAAWSFAASGDEYETHAAYALVVPDGRRIEDDEFINELERRLTARQR